MADIEKVIKALECCIIDPNGLEDCKMNGCPYIKEAEETEEDESLYCQTCLFADALALLKDQQEQIEQMNFIYGFVYGGQVKEIKKLVRCNECRHRDPEDHKCDCGHDIQWQLPRADDWFCADGEEK